MKKTPVFMIIVTALTLPLLTGFKLDSLKDKAKPEISSKCKKAANKTKCMREEQLKTAKKAATVLAVTLAAKAIKDLVIEYKSKRITSDKAVAAEYKKENKKLPKDPTVVSYNSSLKPGQVVKTGKPISIESEVSVVPGKKKKKVFIEEKIEIYDNEDTSAVIKSLVKAVNEKSKKGGKYQNSFSFTLPKGMPQGVYKIKTTVLINGKELDSASNEMQVVFLNRETNSHLLLSTL